MTPLGLNQSGRRKDNRPIVWEVTCLISIGVRHHFVHVTSLDQSEGGIDITWPWVLGMGKRTFTHKFDREKKNHFFNQQFSSGAWWQAGRVWRPSDVTPFFTNLIVGRVHPQSFRSHRESLIGWSHQWRACRTPTHTASRAEPLEFVFFLDPVWNDKGWTCSNFGESPEASLIPRGYCLSWCENWESQNRGRSGWNRVPCTPLYPAVSCTHNSWRPRNELGNDVSV